MTTKPNAELLAKAIELANAQPTAKSPEPEIAFVRQITNTPGWHARLANDDIQLWHEFVDLTLELNRPDAPTNRTWRASLTAERNRVFSRLLRCEAAQPPVARAA